MGASYGRVGYERAAASVPAPAAERGRAAAIVPLVSFVGRVRTIVILSIPQVKSFGHH